MPKIATGLALVGMISVLVGGIAMPALAGSFCGNQQMRATSACNGPVSPLIRELAAQKKRPRVTIYRRRIYPGPNAVRQCRSWLVTEYRISGPVIVPQMRCWWE
jgi:hypothetical protein